MNFEIGKDPSERVSFRKPIIVSGTDVKAEAIKNTLYGPALDALDDLFEANPNAQFGLRIGTEDYVIAVRGSEIGVYQQDASGDYVLLPESDPRSNVQKLLSDKFNGNTDPEYVNQIFMMLLERNGLSDNKILIDDKLIKFEVLVQGAVDSKTAGSIEQKAFSICNQNSVDYASIDSVRLSDAVEPPPATIGAPLGRPTTSGHEVREIKTLTQRKYPGNDKARALWTLLVRLSPVLQTLYGDKIALLKSQVETTGKITITKTDKYGSIDLEVDLTKGSLTLSDWEALFGKGREQGFRWFDVGGDSSQVSRAYKKIEDDYMVRENHVGDGTITVEDLEKYYANVKDLTFVLPEEELTERYVNTADFDLGRPDITAKKMAGGKTEVTLAEIRDQLNKDKVELFNFIVIELGLPETVNLKQLEKLATVFQFASALPKELQKSAKFSGTAIREYEPVTSNEVSDFLSWAFKSDRAQVMNGTKAGSITGTKDSAKSDDDATRKLLREKSKEYSEAKRKGHYAEAAKTAATILETLRVKHPKLYPAGTPEEDVDNAKWLEVYRGQKDDILEKLEKLTTMKEKSALLPLIAELEKALNDKAIFEEESTLELLYAKIDLVIKIAKLKKAAGVPAGEVQAFLDEKSKGIWALGFWDETNQKAKAGLALELANLKADLFIKKEEGAACPLPAGLGVDSELDVIADNWDKELIKSEKGASAEKTKVIFWQMIEQFDTKAEDKDYVFTTEDAINIYMLHALFIGKGDKIGPKDMVKGDTPKVFKGGQEKVLKFFKQVFSNAPTPAPASASAAKVPAGAKKSKGTEKKAGKEKGAPGTGTTPKAENAKGADNKTDGSTASYTVSDIKTSYEGKDVIYKATVSISGGKGNVVVVEMEKGKANALSKKQIATIDGGKWTDLKTTGRVGSNYATIKKQIIDGLKAQKIEIQ